MQLPELSAAISYFNSTPEFSKSAIKKLGKSYRSGNPFDPTKARAIEKWYLGMAENAYVVTRAAIADVLGEQRVAIAVKSSSTRLKNPGTIAEKLARDTYDLSLMQDFAGVRFTIDCLLSELVNIGIKVKSLLENDNVHVSVKEILDEPHCGYRAVHVHITSKSAGRAEVQLRTLLQSTWANAYEKAGDIVGREIRYIEAAEIDDFAMRSVVATLKSVSDQIYNSERANETAFQEMDKARIGLLNRTETLPRTASYFRSRVSVSESLLKLEQQLFDQVDRNNALLDVLEQLRKTLVIYEKTKRKES